MATQSTRTERAARRLAGLINADNERIQGSETAFPWQQPDGEHVVKVVDRATRRERVVRSWRDYIG